MWIRMTLGIGILTLPQYVSIYGSMLSVVLLIISAIVNYLTYSFIFTASYHTGKKSYPEIIKELLGDKMLLLFRFTYMMDVCSTVMIYCIVSWNLFEYMLVFF